METTVKTNGFIIHAPGDRSVGWFDTSWHLTGEFFFNSEHELELFRVELKGVFETYTDPIWIETFEEHDLRMQAEEQYFNPPMEE